MGYVRAIQDISLEERQVFGGKAASLGHMTGAGVRVPQGFVLSIEAYATCFSLLQDRIELALGDKDPVESSARIQQLFLEVDIPESLAKEIQSSFHSLSLNTVSVRSSATVEDAKDTAWAGKFESYLNIEESSLLEAVKKCWASLFTPQSITYMRSHNIPLADMGMAVIVQDMVQASHAGVSFSVHPSLGNTSVILIETVEGLGDALVSGTKTPDKYVVDKGSLYVVEKDGKLPTEQVQAIALVTKDLEKLYGFAVDVEWALQDGVVHVLQCRPVTVMEKAPKPLIKFGTRFIPLILAEGAGRGQLHYLKHILGDAFSTYIVRYDGKICGRPGTRTQRFVEGKVAPLGELVAVGGTDSYAPRCRKHYTRYDK